MGKPAPLLPRIRLLLEDHPDGLSIKQIAEGLGSRRGSIYKVLLKNEDVFVRVRGEGRRVWWRLRVCSDT